MSKSNGSIMRHFGTQWFWVTDDETQLKCLNDLSPKAALESIEKRSHQIDTDFKSKSQKTKLGYQKRGIVKSQVSKRTNDMSSFENTQPFEASSLAHNHSSELSCTTRKLDFKKSYKSPWYISPRNWEKLANISTAKVQDEEERIKNLYYNLHMRKKKFNLYAKEKKELATDLDIRHEKAQAQLVTLPAVQKYKTYLENKKLRIPACLRILDQSEGNIKG
ncbi:unnamed protein product [Blepharisma stoltei]|uniref:Uncharacterized protein n=1 Tax=Blepharisma stoltei TaxID=1481888 RepID=A0AAU9IUL9_9CILI|nr:unnamed protein product [Blepharisma stoltei]